MPSDRIERCFADCAVLVRNTVSPDECIGKRYVALEHIEEGTLRLLGIGDGSEVTSAKSEFRAGDILFGKLRPYFRKVIRPRFDGVCSTDIWVVRAVDGIDQGFLYYWMASKDFVEAATRGSTGTKMPRADWEFVGRLTLPVPSPDTQRRIAAILGSLDDKIELNRRMNRTLERMAQALFKSWFIDFDPVHAKAEGDPTAGGLPEHLAALFPDRFTESDLGPIPEGWTPGKLADVADNPRRTVQPSDVPPTTPYIGLQHMPRRCIALDAWGRADEVDSGKSQFKEGEILFGKLRPYFHKVGIAPVDGVCSTDILVIVPKSAEWHSYVLSLVSSKAFVDYTDSHSAGTKMPRTNWKDMGRYPLALPPEPLAKAFQDHVAALHQRIGLAVRQNCRLAGLRDTLLPKLLSGEIELPEAEAAVEEVVG